MSKFVWEVLEKISSNPTIVFTLQQLAESYLVTPRTIRNYIKQINTEYPGLIIVKQEKIYLNQNTSHTLTLSKFEESRTTTLLKELVTNHHVDYYDFAQKEFIEIPTIEKDIVNLRKRLNSFSIKLVKNGTIVTLKGTERNYRKAISSVLKSEMDKNLYSLSALDNCYSDISVVLLEEIIKKNSKKHSLIINAYAQFDIILHLCISISRPNEIQDNEIETESINQLKSADVNEFIEDIIKDINNEFKINLNTIEKKYLTSLFTSRVSKMNQISDSLHKEYIDSEISMIIGNVLRQTSNKFYFDFENTDLLDKLNLHIQALIDRSRKQQIIKNPFTQNLKNQFPLIYEISVYIAAELQNKLEISITEDEISFFALHIGSFILQNNKSSHLLNCIIVYPEYNGMQHEFVNHISASFSSDLNIVDVVDEMVSIIKQDNIDIIISIIPLQNIRDVIYVSPLMHKADIKTIEQAIESKLKEKSSINIKNSFVQLLSSDLFYTDIYLESEEAYIRFMYDKLKSLHIVNDDFLDSVLLRESMSSTAFNDIVAMPHAMEMTANKTAIVIIINKQPITWGNSRANIIILLALSKNDLEQFYDIFDSLINLFSNTGYVSSLIRASNYNEFVNLIVELLNK
jgi:Transcriptional antiterminator